MNKGLLLGTAHIGVIIGLSQWLMLRAFCHEEQIESAYMHESRKLRNTEKTIRIRRIEEYDHSSFFYKMIYPPDGDLVEDMD